MRGIVLAGGTGSRLGALTATTNKHVLRVHDRPMIRWPIQVLVASGITDIAVVSTPQGVGQIAAELGSGRDSRRDLGCWLTFRVQDEPGGVAAALACAPFHGRHDSVAVILGDNVFLPPPDRAAGEPWPNLTLATHGQARCFLRAVARDRLREFGVPEFGPDGIARIHEKPDVPPSSYAVTGLYVFGQDLPRALELLRPGPRGEYEITDLLSGYARQGRLTHTVLTDPDGFWGDAGTPEGLAECAAACAGGAR